MSASPEGLTIARCEGPFKRPLVRGWCVDGTPVTRCGMGLVLPMPGDMSAGRLENDDDALPPGVADDEEGWDGNIRVTICAS